MVRRVQDRCRGHEEGSGRDRSSRVPTRLGHSKVGYSR